jgi:hypothetical protein
MTPAEEKRLKPSRNRDGGFHDRTQGDRRTNLAVQIVDYDVNDWFIRKPKHNEATDRIIDFIRKRAAESPDPIAVSVTGAASRTGSKEYDDVLSSKRANCVVFKLRTFLAPNILRRVTFDNSGEGFTHAQCRGADCELPEYRSVLVCVHAPGDKPKPIPVVPRGWDKYEIRCCWYDSQDLLAGTLGDILDKDVGRLPPWMHERIARWMTEVIKKGLKSLPKLGGQARQGDEVRSGAARARPRGVRSRRARQAVPRFDHALLRRRRHAAGGARSRLRGSRAAPVPRPRSQPDQGSPG